MIKLDPTKVDLGVSDFDMNLGAMWSDHCIKPFLSASVHEDFVILIGENGEYRGKTTLELLAFMGEEC